MSKRKTVITRAYLRMIARSILRSIHPTVAPSSADVNALECTLTLLVALVRKESR